VTSAEYRQAIDALPFGKRLPGALYLIDPGEDLRIPSEADPKVRPRRG
jgi:hypothetical protein